MQIEGIPEGWEFVGVRKAKRGEFYLNEHCVPEEWCFSLESNASNYVVIRKKRKRYRPFANAAEFEPHRERWIKYFSPFRSDVSLYRITCYNDERVWLGPDSSGKTFAEAMDRLKFDDGTPFGVEVTE